jgi:hypothetical protein
MSVEPKAKTGVTLWKLLVIIIALSVVLAWVLTPLITKR